MMAPQAGVARPTCVNGYLADTFSHWFGALLGVSLASTGSSTSTVAGLTKMSTT
jgi:hypothetical protein